MSRRAMAVGMTVVVLAFLSVLIVLSLHAGVDPYTPSTDDPAVIFQEACARCHGEGGIGGEQEGPRLAGHAVEPGEVKEQLREGKGRMPSFPNIRGQALENLARYVHGL